MVEKNTRRILFGISALAIVWILMSSLWNINFILLTQISFLFLTVVSLTAYLKLAFNRGKAFDIIFFIGSILALFFFVEMLPSNIFGMDLLGRSVSNIQYYLSALSLITFLGIGKWAFFDK